MMLNPAFECSPDKGIWTTILRFAFGTKGVAVSVGIGVFVGINVFVGVAV
jgi:hypothetical protein